MGRLTFPDVPEGPLRALLVELHRLHARAGRPSLDDMARRQNRAPRERFSRDTIHRLFSDCREAPKLPLLHEIVGVLATMAPNIELDEMSEKFDRLWLAVERYDALKLGQGFLYDGVDGDEWSGDHDG